MLARYPSALAALTALAANVVVGCGLDQEGGSAAAGSGGDAAAVSMDGGAGFPTSGGSAGSGGASGGNAGNASGGSAGFSGSAGSSGATGGAGGGTGGATGGTGGATGGTGGATGGTGGVTGGTGGVTGGTGGGTGGATGGTGGSVSLPTCVALYSTRIGVLSVCQQTTTQCQLSIDSDPGDGDPGQSCAAICSQGGGECLNVFDNGATACTVDTNDPRTCGNTTMSEGICFCSRGCGSGKPCTGGSICSSEQCS